MHKKVRQEYNLTPLVMLGRKVTFFPLFLCSDSTASLQAFWIKIVHDIIQQHRFRNNANVCLTNECSRDTSENPALRKLGLLPFYIPVLHIFPYLLLGFKSSRQASAMLDVDPAKYSGFVWQPSAMWQHSARHKFFFPTENKNISGNVRLRS